MPIFSYGCDECKKEFDLLRPMKDCNKVAWCEVCGSQMRHVIEVPGKMVRGAGGWSTTG